MKFTFFVLLFAIPLLFFGACNPFSNGQPGSSVGVNYHPGTDSNAPPLGGLSGVKVSPGGGSAMGNSIAVTANVTTTNFISSGTYVRGKFSIQKTNSR